MTPNEIIKAMDEFAALQAKATKGPWSKYKTAPSDKANFRDGIDWQVVNDEWCIADCSTDNDESDSDAIAASRSIPATEAAALIREMREMLRQAVEPYHDDEHPCMCCRMLVTHKPDCKLAQMLKD